MDSRRNGAKLYRHEYTDDDHRRLIAALIQLPCPVMVSGYSSALYDDSPLATWRSERFNAMTEARCYDGTNLDELRGPGRASRSALPRENFRERERIKRKKARWTAKLAKLDPFERAAIMECLRELEAAD